MWPTISYQRCKFLPITEHAEQNATSCLHMSALVRSRNLCLHY